ncbi:hypothetical protein HC931_23540 [Candidatus Gracilibacteria bacterium]|nr:hypothetical protein [Candidatus Gracilibacteria bacterium]NJM89356.1 hypothetical protein [Hydrococcus sp. RU_2_2]NJP21203.1 hypothetical protein [Hydrococcus sp. CRU_1_1]NJQ97983.1 hypothetical protein [Hydrococcus sp. CSU_1_8]
MTIKQLNRPAIAKINQKKLVARWLRDNNSRLYCQWILEDCEANTQVKFRNLANSKISRKFLFASYIPFDR